MSTKRILAIEDDELLRNMYRTIIAVSIPDCHLDAVEDGRLAMDLFAQHTYDLIISDLNMPEMDGRELFIAITEYCSVNDRQRPPIIFCSAVRSALDTIAELDGQSDVCHLLKPFDVENMISTIQEMLAD